MKNIKTNWISVKPTNNDMIMVYRDAIMLALEKMEVVLVDSETKNVTIPIDPYELINYYAQKAKRNE